MTNKNKDWEKEYNELKNELLIEKTSQAMKNNPKNWQYNLEKIGFVWVDEDDIEEINEDKKSTPNNKNQKNLVSYFEGSTNLDDNIIKIFISEVEVKEPNYPLFRKYFKSRNKNLLALLLSGLSTSPANLTLLSGVDYYHLNNNILSVVINVYLTACKEKLNRENFKEVVLSFVDATSTQGYDAMEELKIIYRSNHKKLESLKEIDKILSKSYEDINF
jgi:hypothetical protein